MVQVGVAVIWIAVDCYDGGSSVRGMAGARSSLPKPGYGGGWYLRDDAHVWLMSYVDDYQFEWRSPNWVVGIQDPKIAMLFKLTWC